jgi:hypothetical protein
LKNRRGNHNGNAFPTVSGIRFRSGGLLSNNNTGTENAQQDCKEKRFFHLLYLTVQDTAYFSEALSKNQAQFGLF